MDGEDRTYENEGDEGLVERAREGDSDALACLLERHRQAMQRFADARMPGRLRRRVSVADVVQEAQLVALDRAAEFEPRGPDSFRNWLFGIVDRKVRETIRNHDGAAKRSLRREVTRAARRETGQFRARQPTPSQVAIGAETADLAERAMAALSDDHRTVLRLTRREHLRLEEVADRMGRSRDAVRKLLDRALTSFASELARLQGESRGG
jgi:RNA polymerase sigma-70 factor (ECF subfamily)